MILEAIWARVHAAWPGLAGADAVDASRRFRSRYRAELSHLYLHHGRQRFPCGCSRVWPAVIDYGHRHDLWGATGRGQPSAIRFCRSRKFCKVISGDLSEVEICRSAISRGIRLPFAGGNLLGGRMLNL